MTIISVLKLIILRLSTLSGKTSPSLFSQLRMTCFVSPQLKTAGRSLQYSTGVQKLVKGRFNNSSAPVINDKWSTSWWCHREIADRQWYARSSSNGGCYQRPIFFIHPATKTRVKLTPFITSTRHRLPNKCKPFAPISAACCWCSWGDARATISELRKS